MNKGIKGYFITGFVIVVPLYISFYVIMVIVNFMDSSIIYALPGALRPDTYLKFRVPGLGLLITVAGIFVVGVIATNFLGKKIVRLGEAALGRIPVFRVIYKSTKQFMETFFSKDSEGFRKVVLVEFPRKGLYSIGFVTSVTKGEVHDLTKESTVNVFLPTTPNPTSGFYFAVSEKDVMPMSMTVEEAFKVIMSGGIIVPQYKPSHTD
ncbi:MAG: DUF502 domain-containing protein [Deltaproteobacteria bacterium]|nr:DUF502 domain-containing protein [Deltaproteobacteria bacterium]